MRDVERKFFLRACTFFFQRIIMVAEAIIRTYVQLL